jgi:hypothetical protein
MSLYDLESKFRSRKRENAKFATEQRYTTALNLRPVNDIILSKYFVCGIYANNEYMQEVFTGICTATSQQRLCKLMAADRP